MKKLILFTFLLAPLAGFCSSVSDACGNSYPAVTIGNQTWMAENLRCNKYDTDSEAYNDGVTSVPTSSTSVFTPYYTDATDKSNWDDDSKQRGATLDGGQVAQLGYLYNWAAAVGVKDGEKRTSGFKNVRQGICPNGWHMPTAEEWKTLRVYIESTDGKGKDTAGKYLKATSGWYSNDNNYKAGLDSYGFNALSAGYAVGTSVSVVGTYANFWSASPDKSSDGNATDRYFTNTADNMYSDAAYKDYARSVRCLKN